MRLRFGVPARSACAILVTWSFFTFDGSGGSCRPTRHSTMTGPSQESASRICPAHVAGSETRMPRATAASANFAKSSGARPRLPG